MTEMAVIIITDKVNTVQYLHNTVRFKYNTVMLWLPIGEIRVISDIAVNSDIISFH